MVYCPILIQDTAPGLGNGRNERTPGLCQRHGNGAISIISHNYRFNFFAGVHKGGRTVCNQRVAIISGGTTIHKTGNIALPNSKERLGQ